MSRLPRSDQETMNLILKELRKLRATVERRPTTLHRRCFEGKCVECGAFVEYDEKGWFCPDVQCWREALRKVASCLDALDEE